MWEMSIGSGVACCGAISGMLGAIYIVRTTGKSNSNGWSKVLANFQKLINEIEKKLVKVEILIDLNGKNIEKIEKALKELHA